MTGRSARNRYEPLVWFWVGVVVGTFLVVTQAIAVGGLAGLLAVGESSELRPVIEAELGMIPLSPGSGHDGQISYAIGLDLLGDEVPTSLDHAGYRYRRILYPAIASIFGSLGGQPLLWSLVGMNVAALGLATAALLSIARSLGRSTWIVMGVLANPGVWLSVRLLTVDMLAIALALSSIALWLNRRFAPAVVAVALAVLAKDQYLVVAFSIAAYELWQRRPVRSAIAATVPSLALTAWAVWIGSRMSGTFSPRGNLDLPLAGIVEAAAGWGTAPGADVALNILLIISTVAAVILVGVPRNRPHTMFVAPWIVLALISSEWVWAYGNNAARAFAPILVWLAVGVGHRSSITASMDRLDVAHAE